MLQTGCGKGKLLNSLMPQASKRESFLALGIHAIKATFLASQGAAVTWRAPA